MQHDDSTKNSVADKTLTCNRVHAVPFRPSSTHSCRHRGGAGRLPRGAAIFPLVVCELLYLGTVGAHDEDLAVGLRRPDDDLEFVFRRWIMGDYLDDAT